MQKNLIALHVFGNALLMLAAYYWLGIGESTGPRLIWSALVALLVVLAALWLHGAANVRADFGVALRTAARNLAPLFLLAVVVSGVYFGLDRWKDYSATPAFNTASWLTLKLRRPVKPQTVQSVLDGALFAVRWIVVPVLLLPAFSAASARGWAGLKACCSRRSLLYWIEVPVLLLIALAVPLKLLGWVPKVEGFWVQTVSLVLRAGFGYLLFVAGSLTLAFLSSGGSPLRSQSSTATSP